MSVVNGGLFDTITGFVGGLFYPLFSIIFALIDAVQNVFYSFAGIGDAAFGATLAGQYIGAGNSGGERDTGLLYFLLNNSLVKNMLISIAILGLFLMIIFTVMAFIKNIYSAKQKGWKEIIGLSIKGLANFVFLPVCVLLGVWLGNILLQAINGATSGTGGGTSMSRKLFIAAAYNSNEFRNNDENAIADPTVVEELKQWIQRLGGAQALFNVTTETDEEGKEYIKEIEGLKDGQTNGYYANIVDYIYENSNVNIVWWKSVENWYSLYEINYLVLIVGGIFMLYALGSISFAMIKRIFFLLILFIISPGVCALYPLDEGKTVQSWSGEVKKQVLSAYGAVAGLNLFFALVPLIDKISIFSDPTYMGWGVSDIIQIFIFVTGLLVVKDIIALISGFVGGDNAYSTGAGLMKQTTQKIGGTATKTAGVFARAAGAKKAGGSFIGSLMKQGAGGFEKMVGFDRKKIASEFKEGQEQAFDGKKARTASAKARKLASDANEILKDEGIKRHRVKNFFAGEIGFGKQIMSEDELFAMLEREDVKGNKKLQEELVRRYLASKNRHEGHIWSKNDKGKIGFSQLETEEDVMTKFTNKQTVKQNIEVISNEAVALQSMFEGLGKGSNSYENQQLSSQFSSAMRQFAETFKTSAEASKGDDKLIFEEIARAVKTMATKNDSAGITAVIAKLGKLKSLSSDDIKDLKTALTKVSGMVKTTTTTNNQQQNNTNNP